MSPFPDPIHSDVTSVGYLHPGGRESSDSHGLHHPSSPQK